MPNFHPCALVNCAINLESQQSQEFIEFIEFNESINEFEDQQKKILLRAWLALEAIPQEKGIERLDLLNVIRGLRQAWFKIKYTRSIFSPGVNP